MLVRVTLAVPPMSCAPDAASETWKPLVMAIPVKPRVSSPSPPSMVLSPLIALMAIRSSPAAPSTELSPPLVTM